MTVAAETERQRAFVYARLSEDRNDDGGSVPTQLADAKTLASVRGYIVTDEFVDGSISAAKSGKRPEFARLLAAVEAGGCEVVVSRDWDRLSRNRRDDLAIYEACENVLLAFTRGVDLDLSTGPGQMFADIMSMRARAEIREKSDRTIRANRARASQGKPSIGTRLTGYETDGRIRPAEADTVRTIFHQFTTGESLRSIANHLDPATARRGKGWTPATLRSILTNPRYAGVVIYRGQPVDVKATWDAIIDRDQYDLAQAILLDPRRRLQRSTERQHLGSGLYLCGLCGARVGSWSGNRYGCPKGHLTRVRPPIDAVVVDLIEARLARTDLAGLLAKTVDPTEAKRLMAESQRLTSRLKRIGDDYDAELIDGHRYREAREKALAELEQIQQVQARIAATSGVDSILAAPDPLDAFRAGSLTARRRVVSALVEVKLHPAPRGRKAFDPNSVSIKPPLN